MYRASDRVDNAAWIDRLDDACATLDLDEEALSTATDLFLSRAPDDDRGKRVAAAASLYAAALIAGARRRPREARRRRRQPLRRRADPRTGAVAVRRRRRDGRLSALRSEAVEADSGRRRVLAADLV